MELVTTGHTAYNNHSPIKWQYNIYIYLLWSMKFSRISEFHHFATCNFCGIDNLLPFFPLYCMHPCTARTPIFNLNVPENGSTYV